MEFIKNSFTDKDYIDIDNSFDKVSKQLYKIRYKLNNQLLEYNDFNNLFTFFQSKTNLYRKSHENIIFEKFKNNIFANKYHIKLTDENRKLLNIIEQKSKDLSDNVDVLLPMETFNKRISQMIIEYLKVTEQNSTLNNVLKSSKSNFEDNLISSILRNENMFLELADRVLNVMLISLNQEIDIDSKARKIYKQTDIQIGQRKSLSP